MHQEQLQKMESNLPSQSAETKFLMFENKSNNCWLDASMALVAHNQALKRIAGCNPVSKLYEIIHKYTEAVFILNDNSDTNIELKIKAAKEKLQSLQIHTLEYLQPMLKCQIGEPDSAFCALLNLIYENKCIKERLTITWLWRKKCMVCNTSKLTQSSKPIITLSKVNYFMPDCPTSVYVCSCKTEQEMKLVYKELPPCLFFHFENGAGKGESPPLFFVIQDRKYHLTSVITLEKGEESSVNHFITWIRDPNNYKWLECNDLNSNIISFVAETPLINLKDVYMYVYESFDKIGKMSIEISADFAQEQDFGNTNVELIDLSDESEDVKPAVVPLSTTQNAEISKESATNLDGLPKQSPAIPIKQEKLDSVKKTFKKESDTSEEKKRLETKIPSGMLKETGTQELNTCDKGKVTHALNTSTNQQVAKGINNSAGESRSQECSSISNAGQKKLPVSSPNVPATVDSVKTLQSKAHDETKPFVYSKTPVRNVRFIHQETIPMFNKTSYKSNFARAALSSIGLLRQTEREQLFKETKLPEVKKTDRVTSKDESQSTGSMETIRNSIETSLSNATLLQKKESEKVFKEIKLHEVKKSNKILSSDRGQSAGYIETTSKNKTVASLLQQRKELKIESHAVSHIKSSSFKTDCSKKLSHREPNPSNVKNALIAEKNKDDSLIVGDLNPTIKKNFIVKKERLSDTYSVRRKDVTLTPNILKIREHVEKSTKIINKMETVQNDASADKTNVFKTPKFSVFSKVRNKAETFQINNSHMHIEETSVENNDSISVKSSHERKRKPSSQQDMSESGELVLPAKICKILLEVETDKTETEGGTESPKIAQRKSTRKVTKSRKYITDYYDVSLIPLPEESIKNENTNKVSSRKNRASLKDEMYFQNQLSKKSAVKAIYDDCQLMKIIDARIPQAFNTFMEHVVHRNDFLP